ncbi:MAG: hypothetical protein HZB36_07090 [Candidatus Omnitrophica bacterium]|nr:hypothetical protein [Candidatus Omnitrophota bacterium]
MTTSIGKVVVWFTNNFKDAIRLFQPLIWTQVIQHDLEWVIDVGQKYIVCFHKIKDYVIHEVFWSAIIVRYGRANNTGRHHKMPHECIRAFSKAEKDNHDFFINMRDKYYCHSVNNYENNILKVWIKDADSANPILEQVGVVHERVIRLSIKDAQAIVALADKLLKHLESYIIEEKRRLMEVVKATPFSCLIKNQFPVNLETKESAGKERKRKL